MPLAVELVATQMRHAGTDAVLGRTSALLLAASLRLDDPRQRQLPHDWFSIDLQPYAVKTVRPPFVSRGSLLGGARRRLRTLRSPCGQLDTTAHSVRALTTRTLAAFDALW